MKNGLIILFIVSLIGFLSYFAYDLYEKNQKLEFDIDFSVSNMKALQDSVRVQKNKAGQLEFTKQALVLRKDELEKANNDLYKELKKEKGKVIYLQKAVAEINSAPEIPVDVDNDVNYLGKSKYTILTKIDTFYNADNYRKLLLETTVQLNQKGIDWSTSRIIDDVIGFNVITGLKEENGNLRITMRSDHPKITFSKIDGSLIDPQKSDILRTIATPKPKVKKYSFGPVVGYGLDHRLRFSLFVGVGVQYKIIEW